MSNKFGYGQQGPNDSTSEFNAISFLVNRILARVRTVAMVKVMAIEPAGLAPVGLLNAQLLVNQLDGSGNSVPHATVFNLPYFRLQGGTNAVIIDPAVDDIGLALICDRDSSAVKASKAQANPGSFRRFDLADGVYIGGILNGTPEQYVRMSDAGITIADKFGHSIVMASAGITINGNVVVNGTIAGPTGVTLTLHVHSANNTPPTPGH